ncbi:hypothetical protein FRB99_008081 [Tulasnella sp. 403]|nr:hypothetical protein FRB99_008081 [Tulasnella sp. 403]
MHQSGVPLYVSPNEEVANLQVQVAPQLAEKVVDPALRSYVTFGSEIARRQCKDFDDLESVSRSNQSFDWEAFPQIIWSRGYRLVNLPARAIYPNGVSSCRPSMYPTDVIDDIIKQFAHPNPQKRFGLINTNHDTRTYSLMSKVTKNNNSNNAPIEWIAVPARQQRQATISGCRCNLCIDTLLGGAEHRPGLHLIVDLESSKQSPILTSTEWADRWTRTEHVFNFVQPVSDPNSSSSTSTEDVFSGTSLSFPTPATERFALSAFSDSIPVNSELARDTLASARLEGLIPGGLRSTKEFLPAFVNADVSDTGSEYAPILNFDDTSDISSDSNSECSLEADPPFVAEDTTVEISSIQQAELEWDIEDLATDERRAAEDAEVKRKRAEEDHSKDVTRKKRRIMLEVEYQMDQRKKEREEEDRRLQAARKQEDELAQQRLRDRLASIE